MNENNDEQFMQYSEYYDAFPDGRELDISDELFDETADYPFIPLRDLVLYPQMVMPLFVGRERSLAAVKAALNKSETLVVAAQRDSEIAEPDAGQIYAVGTEVVLGKTIRMPDNTTSVLAQGRRRMEIVEFTQWQPYIRVRVRPIYEPMEWERHTEALMRAVLTLFERVVSLNHSIPEDAFAFAINIDEPGWLADFIASSHDFPLKMRQDLLETPDPSDRLKKVSILLAKELELLELEGEIHAQVQQEVDKSQREHFLREQMRVIQGELGEGDVFAQELNDLHESVARKSLPPAVRAKAEKELARLRSIPPMAPEVGIIRTYLDWIIDLPWLEQSDNQLDIKVAAKILDRDHYGLEKVKDRILEYIAVQQIAPPKLKSPILCFVGPPGTGKTSMGRSIAEALGRKFVRLSLGGVHDEAEIRGHRRTYIGAMPGRIIQSMRRAGTNNPLFMLDEVDKLGSDYRGDPAAALLEVLDPEQNFAFSDHYLDLDFDLSNVMFITTANYLDAIPHALQDRMEVIEFSSYLEEEKLSIADQFLMPRQLEQHGLDEVGVRFDSEAVKTIIRNYTLEAGVRNLERKLGSICRKIARNVAEEKRVAKRITARKVEELLGPARFTQDTLLEEDEVGVATGVAWTVTGGALMFIEVNLMPGKGGLTLTGQLGDVMQESAQAAMTYTRSQAKQLGIDPGDFDKYDVHIHIPEGSVPKDGPSAGVSITAAIVSAFTNRPVRRDVSMTGEITLRGRVLPVGGIREKALAARRMGIHTFILPKRNESELDDIPKKLQQTMRFVLANRMDQVLETAVRPLPPPARKRLGSRRTNAPPPA